VSKSLKIAPTPFVVECDAIAQPILNGLANLPEVQKVEIAGSLRRKLETIGDLDPCFFLLTENCDGMVHNATMG